MKKVSHGHRSVAGIEPPATRHEPLKSSELPGTGGCIHELFETQAQMRPEAIALVHEGQVLSYAELNQRANRLAHHLRALGVGPDTRVVVLMERRLETVVAMLAILKAGGAYVPLDLASPPGRLAYMLQDTAPAALLVDANTAGHTALNAVAVPVLDLQGVACAWARESEANPGCASIGLNASHLAYVIYTSGSTGVPKGVMVEHRNVVSLVVDNTFAPIGADDCLAHCANPAFDASTWEVWAALLNGARVHVVSQRDVLEPSRLARQLCEGGVSALWLTVALFNAYVDELGEALSRLRVLIVGGDALNPRTMARLLNNGRAPHHVLNGYGPTETTTFASTFELESAPDLLRSVPIGQPIAGTAIYILDETRQPVAKGATGEIYIGGAGVARGYMNRAELTAERFVNDPFAARSDARMYRTGDLGRWLDDGNIEYLGRNDLQVKIRGFRVELREIEARLEGCAGVKDAVVVAREDSPADKRLVAYVTVQAQAQWSVGLLRSELASVLPDYMMPSAIVRIEALPLTPNGKLDRMALPAPDAQAYARRDHEAPVGDTERLLACLWVALLGVEQVGRHDNFFELGGHSLLATRLVGRLRQQLGCDIAVQELFDHPVLADFAAVLARVGRADCLALSPADRTRALPLSWAQERLWFLDQLDARAGRAYHLSFAYRLIGPALRRSLQWALDRLLQRHESLRTTFVDVEGVPVQVIAPARRIELQEHDLTRLDAPEREAAAQALLTEESHRPFDVGAGPLMRGLLLRLSPDTHELLLVQHHMVSDGWSVGVMLHELAALYNAHAQGQADPLPAPSLQYADYAAWQQRPAQREGVRSRLPFWCEHLRGAPPVLELPIDRPRPPRQSYRGDELAFSLAPELTAALHRFGRRHGVTLFMTLLAGWAALLSRLCGQDDLVIGTPVANRPRPEFEPLIGFFANTLALRIGLHDDPRVGELAARVKALALAAYAHEDVPFGQVVEALQPARSLNRNPLFQTMLALNNTPAAGNLALRDLDVRAFDLPQRGTQFDLSVSFDELGARLQGRLEYARDLFERQSVQRISDYFQTLLSAMVADDSLLVSQLPLLSRPDRHQVLRDFNATALSFPGGACVHELFEAQAARTPDAIALVHEGRTLSYAELNRQANRLAHRLKKLGVGPDARVAICTERSAEMVVGLLAILKAGGAYVPLDPVYPAQRLNGMLQDSAAVAVVLGGSAARLDTGAITVLDLHAPASWADEADVNPGADGLGPQHLAYVIYTSGSTGAPKGVMVEHANVVNLVHTHVHNCALTEADAVLQFASFSFDASVEEIFAPLSVGARTVLRPQQLVAPDEAFMQWLHAQRITVAELPTAFWHQWAQQEAHSVQPPQQLRLVVVGGEKVERRHLDKWRASALGRRCQWLNTYGPTEATVYASALRVDGCDELPEGEISIGKPIANTRIYILDPAGQPTPIGVTGEIHIGGRQVARGYLNRPELTAQRFVADPFHGEPAARMYKTGDLGRWRADGSIEYLGRNDHQVKLRGFRIELGEIEARLAEHASVREAVVLTRADAAGDKRLVAYVSTALPEALDIEALRRHLSAALPEHMVPAAYVALASLPLTPNGKLDRRALPAPDADAYVSRAYEAPVGEVETVLARIWAEVLHHERVGRHDNFFELGGHSLLAITLVERMRRAELRTEVRHIFAAPTLAALADATEEIREIVL
jgi:amino acid adenylation domain-containing protein